MPPAPGAQGDHMQRAATAYFQTQVTTTSQGGLLVMLYDAAIKFLNQSKEALAANDMAKKGIGISKALDVLNELSSTLNMEKGGNLSQNLHSLYIFCTNHLVRANLKKDAQMIDEVIKILSSLRSAYAEILVLPEAQAADQKLASEMRATAILPPRMPAAPVSRKDGAAHAPGANARLRGLYARNDGQLPADYRHPVQEEKKPEPLRDATAGPQTPAHIPPAPPAFSPPGGLVSRSQGAGLYKKFA
jgi:flagellar protein FliS